MMKFRAWGIVLAWTLLCVASGPLWVVGFALSWSNWLVNSVIRWFIKWFFWLPTRRVWVRLVESVRLARATHSPEVADELERQRKGRDFARRVRRVAKAVR